MKRLRDKPRVSHNCCPIAGADHSEKIKNRCLRFVPVPGPSLIPVRTYVPCAVDARTSDNFAHSTHVYSILMGILHVDTRKLYNKIVLMSCKI